MSKLKREGERNREGGGERNRERDEKERQVGEANGKDGQLH